MFADSPRVDVTDNATQNRFELRLNGDLVGIVGYYDAEAPSGRPGTKGSIVSFMHTVIVDDFGHRGLAGTLVAKALEAARSHGWRVRPVCTYVQRFVAANPEYRDVVISLRPARAR